MAEFPLFHLDPELIINILENLNVYEIVNLSLCSINSFKFAKIVVIGRERLCRTQAYVSLQDRDPFISLSTHREPRPSTYYIFSSENMSESLSYTSKLNLGEAYGAHFLQSITSHRCYFAKNKLAFFWEDENEGMRILLKHIMMLYDVTRFQLSLYIDYKDLLETLDLINSSLGQGRTIQYITLFAKKFASEKVLKTWDIFDRLSPDTSIDLYVELGAPIRQLVYSQFTVFTASWVTSQWLLAFNCKNIYLTRTNLTSVDINVYLKGWLEGACPNVERIAFGEVEVNFPVMMEGIPASDVQEDFNRFDGAHYKSFTVRRHCGVTANVSARYPTGEDPTAKHQLRMEITKAAETN